MAKKVPNLIIQRLLIPEEFFLEKKSVFVSSEIVPARFEKRIQSSLLTPYFNSNPFGKEPTGLGGIVCWNEA